MKAPSESMIQVAIMAYPEKVCSVEGCTGKYKGRGYVAFLESLIGTDITECIPYPGRRAKDGYGRVGNTTASRYMCRLAHGNPPDSSLDAAHSCGRGHEGCVNPNHLRWRTRQQNQMERRDHGTMVRGEMIVQSKLTETDVREIKRLLGQVSQAQLAEQFGVSQPAISEIARGRNWSWVE